MELSFYEKLSPEQKFYARIVAQKAREMGVPPELAVSIAFKESSLNPAVQAGGAGEIGIMQVKPDTAKEVGISAEELKDPKKNIEAGLKYLKKSLDMSEGDPRLAAAGYNAGVNHPFFKSSEAQLPPITVNYLKDLKGFGAFTNIPVATAQAQPAETQPAEAQESEADIAQRKEIDKTFENVARERGELLGLSAGAAETARRTIGPSARFLGRSFEEGRLAADTQAGSGPRTPVQMQGQLAPDLAAQQTAANRILQGTTDVDSGTTGRARMGGFNIETAQQAARAKQQAQNIGALQRAGVVSQGAPDILAKSPGMTSTPSGVLYPRTAPPTPPSRGALEEVKQVFKNMLGPESGVGKAGRLAFKYAGPPALGMQAGSELGSMYHEMGKQEPDYTKMALSGMGAAGAVMSAFPATAPIGVPMAITGPLLQYLRENRPQGPLGQMQEVTGP